MAISSNGLAGLKPGVVDNTAARPSTPFEGQMIFQKDTDQLLIWNGTAWVIPNQTTQNPQGLELIKSQTIGTAVSSVVVSDVFSSTYNHYLIKASGGVASTVINFNIQLGSTTSGYKYQLLFGGWNNTASAEGSTAASSFRYCGGGDTTGFDSHAEIMSPFESKYTRGLSSETATGDGGFSIHVLPTSTSFTGFTFIPTSGTITGGTIRVYGYRNS